MKEVDEFGMAQTEKATSGVEVNFPLRKMSVSTGFTADYLRRATVSEIVQVAINAQEAYLERMQAELKFGIYNDDNYNFVDKFGDGSTLAVKAFLNADLVAIPNAPDGTTFTASTHNHYVGSVGAALAASDIDLLISNVTEDGLTKGVALFINSGTLLLWRLLLIRSLLESLLHRLFLLQLRFQPLEELTLRQTLITFWSAIGMDVFLFTLALGRFQTTMFVLQLVRLKNL